MPKDKNTTSNSTTSNGSRRLVSIDPGVNKIGLASFEGKTLTDYTVKIIPYAPLVRERLYGIDKVVTQYLNEKQPNWGSSLRDKTETSHLIEASHRRRLKPKSPEWNSRYRVHLENRSQQPQLSYLAAAMRYSQYLQTELGSGIFSS